MNGEEYSKLLRKHKELYFDLFYHLIGPCQISTSDINFVMPRLLPWVVEKLEAARGEAYPDPGNEILESPEIARERARPSDLQRYDD